MEKVIKNLKLFGATIGLATSLVCSSPVTVHAEEDEILWENDKDDHHEEDINDVQPDNSIVTPAPAPETPAPTQITIDATNWDPKSEPNAGQEIPDYVQTEAERKGLTTPTPEPSTPENPTPTPENPTPDTPENPTPETPSKSDEPAPIPKTGNTVGNVFLIIGSAVVCSSLTAVIIKFIGFNNDEKAINLMDENEEEEEKESKLKRKRR